MNHVELPALSNVLVGFEPKSQQRDKTAVLNHKELETSCIDLLSQLESIIAKARELDSDDFIDGAAPICRKVLKQVSTFTDEFLTGSAAEQANEEIGKADTHTYAYEEVLTTRSFTNAFLRSFWEVEERPEIVEAHERLGDALVRATAVSFYHVVLHAGLDSEVGQKIDQSTSTFVTQLKEVWRR
ncbi:MAG: hypothetical protein AB8B55_20420 [Mariniblastus sp.]